ncbi:hypothetical protein P692DRAFT_201098208 [Suillus brevipes Sb2]|nr:hypothetical protein P692DRAFT_201098208 [Suillus brevipes Sb2]
MHAGYFKMAKSIWKMDTGRLKRPMCCRWRAENLFGLYRPWYHTVLVFALSYADATPILAHWGLTTKVLCNQQSESSAFIHTSDALHPF